MTEEEGVRRCRDKTNPPVRVVARAARNTLRFGSWVLCHADSQPEAAREDKNAARAARR